MIAITDLLSQSLFKVWVSFTHNWPFLLASILISVALKLYINPQKVSTLITRYRRAGIVGATAAAVTTPFCSCGTTAVILGLIASTIPWSPIVAFMVASPLTSPQELVYSAGLFGWPFAIAFFVSSILLGLIGGVVAEFFEGRGWLENQARFQIQPASVSGIGEGKIRDIRVNRPVMAARPALAIESCCTPALVTTACACSPSPAAIAQATSQRVTQHAAVAPASSDFTSAKDMEPEQSLQKVTLRQWVQEIYRTGKQLLPMFLGFAYIGYFLNGLIPEAWVAAVFGGGNVYSVPLAATLGVPLYINTEGSLPLVSALIESGMSQGAALAFLITGAGTSFGALAGALTIARWRVIALVVGTLWAGSIVLGFGYDFLLAASLF